MQKATILFLLIAVLLGGCLNIVQYDAIPEDRRLGIDGISVTEVNTGGYNLSVTLNVGYSQNGDRYENVSVRAFHRQGEAVCTTSLGTVNYTQDPVTNLSCRGFPNYVVLFADSTPCDDNVRIEYAVYKDFKDEQDRYVIKTRSCDKRVPSVR